MANFTLFLIHGIGVHKDASWADQTIELLDQAWQRDIKLGGSIAEQIKIVPISYDSVFEDYLDDFSDLSKAVFHDGIDLSSEEKQSLSDTFVENEVNERHFVWSYLVDVLLYKMSLVREQANALVAKQIYQEIAKGSTADNFGIIAHSLGTRVVNDTLQRMKNADADKSNFYAQGYRLKFLMQISDVTDLFGLPFGRDSFPPKDVFARDTFDYFRSVSNRFDPIARIIPAKPQHWPEGRTGERYMGRGIYRDILLDHVHETNVHGLTHYMLHPEITDEIFELCGFGRLLHEREERHDAFPALGPAVEPSLRDALNSFMASAASMIDGSWQTYVNLVLKFGDFSMEHDHAPGEHHHEHIA